MTEANSPLPVEFKRVFYGGWIPILTSELIFIDSPLNKIFDVSDSYDILVCKVIFNKDFKSFSLSYYEDDNSDSGKEIFHHEVRVITEKTGLILLEINYSEDLAERFSLDVLSICRNSLRTVRDVYHRHVHNMKDEDISLRGVIIDDAIIPRDVELSSIPQVCKDFIIKDILSQYQKKIINYHHELSPKLSRHTFNSDGFMSFLRTKLSFHNAIEYAFSGIGEFWYAKSFILKNINEIQHKDLCSIFENASQSLETRQKNYIWKEGIEIAYFGLLLAFIALILTIFTAGNSLIEIVFQKGDTTVMKVVPKFKTKETIPAKSNINKIKSPLKKTISVKLDGDSTTTVKNKDLSVINVSKIGNIISNNYNTEGNVPSKSVFKTDNILFPLDENSTVTAKTKVPILEILPHDN